MSWKMLLLLALLGAGAFVVARAEPPPPPEALAAGDTAAVRDVSYFERLRYTVGSVGSAIVAGAIQRSVLENQQNLQEMRSELYAVPGSDGARIRAMARRINYLDSLSVQNLYYGRPIQAMRQSIESKSLLNSIKKNLTAGV